MAFPLAETITGGFLFVSTCATGILAIMNTLQGRKINSIEKKKTANDRLEIENNILEQILPILEKKDAALDKIADILENTLRNEQLTATEISQLRELIFKKCEAPKLIAEIIRIEAEMKKKGVRKDLIGSLFNEYENTDTDK